MRQVRLTAGLLLMALALRAQSDAARSPRAAAQAREAAAEARERSDKAREKADREREKADKEWEKADKEWEKLDKVGIHSVIKESIHDVIEGSTRAAFEIAQNIGNGIGNGIGNSVVNFSYTDGFGSYNAGQQALDRRDYDNAIRAFDRVLNETPKSSRADGALYWKAYAQHRSGKRDQAIATLAELEKAYPQSRWLNDGRALAAEARAGAPSPEAQSDEELKLLALNSLINQEPDRAIPLLEKILADAKSSPSLKRQSLFVLARTRSPKAAEILTQYAKGGTNPDLQMKAIEYLGTSRSPENLQTLTALYAGSDATLKREVIRSLRRQDASKQLVDLARRESDLTLKKELVRELSQMRSKEATDYLMELLSK